MEQEVEEDIELRKRGIAKSSLFTITLWILTLNNNEIVAFFTIFESSFQVLIFSM